MTLGNCQAHWNQTLNGTYPKEEIRSLLIMALTDRFNWSAIDLITQKETVISSLDLEWLNNVLKRLQSLEPMQQILGYTWFCDQKFLVTPDVLIPRPETEELVMYLREHLKGKEVRTALDIGTGSGCIALSLAHSMPKTKWFAWDVSTMALTVAQRNQKQFKQQVHWQRQDVLEPWPQENYDLIVSNPPYIPQEEQFSMDQNVVDYEPHLALFVPQEDPLKFYTEIIQKGFKCLNHGGGLYFECHFEFTQGVAVQMQENGYIHVKKWKDQWGKWRFVSGLKP
jgi:release factor glutamine methyltransferase